MDIISETENIFAFTSKLVCWHQEAEQNKISAFSNLGEFLEDSDQVSFDGAIKGLVLTRHLVKLQKPFCRYFPDLDIQSVSWMVNHFLCDVSKVAEKLEGLVEKLRYNNEAPVAFEFEQCLQAFWMCRAVRALRLCSWKPPNSC